MTAWCAWGVVSVVCASLAGADKLQPNCYDRQSDRCEERAANALPTSPEELIKLRDELAKDPWGGGMMFMYALMVWHQDPALGEKLLVLTVSEDNVQKEKDAKKGVYNGYSLRGNVKNLLQVFEKNKHCARSYAVGSSPDNDYEMDPKTVAMRFRKQDDYVGTIESGDYKVFVCSSGADSCRPLRLLANAKGLWKVKEFSSVMVGCKPMKSSKSDPAKDKAVEDL
jgi:hypothetical protein